MEGEAPLPCGFEWARERSEGELVSLSAGGDIRAFEALVARYQRRVYGFALRYLRDRDEAADLAQEIFLRLYRKADRFDPRRPFEPWFWRLAARVSADYVEKRSVSARALPLEEVGEPEASGNGLSVRQETTLGSALYRLPRSYRLPLLLHYELGLSLQEVAEVTGASVPAVKSRLHRARLELQRELCRKELV